MRTNLPVKVLRSSWFYVLVGVAVFLLVSAIMAQWTYENNSWVHFHVQELIAQVRRLTTPEPSVVPKPSVLVAAPTFAPTLTDPPPTAAPTAAAATATGQPGSTQAAQPT